MPRSSSARANLYAKFERLIAVDFNLSRSLISFQANKDEPFYGWFKYREGFSSSLVRYFIDKYHPAPGVILDPFAGAGSTLFTARALGWKAVGIEVLPIGKFVVEARLAAEKVDLRAFKQAVADYWAWRDKARTPQQRIRHIPITQGAFPVEAESELNGYLDFCDTVGDENVRMLLRFAAFCVLEEISFTRKDGQYMRWDYRAGRSIGKTRFNKGKIYSFAEAMERKFYQFDQDLNPIERLELFSPRQNSQPGKAEPEIILGSSLKHLPTLAANSCDMMMTSPPYCNRYDYTRTYALELVFLGHDDEDVKTLRQEMLSCTVENREKIKHLEAIYDNLNRRADFAKASSIYNSCEAMKEVNAVLEELNGRKCLNNANIPRMVRNYFLEMCFIIFEMQRLLKPGGIVVMVNDNVRYGGEEIPVDLILSEFAVQVGLTVQKIWTLPTGKGNSSQQMGNHGKTELRKGVYVWKKAIACLPEACNRGDGEMTAKKDFISPYLPSSPYLPF
jgi:hypothetical protein